MGRNGRIAIQIAQIAARQHGNISRAQLLAIGLDASWITRAIKAGRLYRVYHGVYAVGRPPATPVEKAAAAVLACGERAALSHSSAMVLWGFWKRWEEPFEVSLATDRRPSAIRTHRVTGLLRRDVTLHQDIRVTSPARTLLDGAPRTRPRSLTRYVNDARRDGMLTQSDLLDVVERFPLHPGAPLLASHAHNTQNPTRSSLEDDFLAFCRRVGLPTPILDTVLHGYEIDALFADELVIVELDGPEYHSDRAAFEADRERDATMLAHGIPTIRITPSRLKTKPQHEAERLHTILAGHR